MNGDRAASSEPDAEHDFYGATYLPRKFKIAIASTRENCVDILAQDLGLVPMVHPRAGRRLHCRGRGGARSLLRESRHLRAPRRSAHVRHP